jgi:methyl-accepting chemotaxis protein
MNWTINRKLFLMGLAGVLSIGLLGAATFWAVASLERAADMVRNYQALLGHDRAAATALGDVRADALQAAFAGTAGDAAQVAATKKALAEHGKSLADRLDALAQSGLDAEVQKEAAHIKGDVATYLALADAIVNSAVKDPKAAQEYLPGVFALYADMSGDFQKLRQLVDTGVQRIQARDAATTSTARWVMSGAGLAAMLGVVLMSLLLARSIKRPFNQAIGLTDKVAAGDLTAELDMHTQDEAGKLVAALNTMKTNLVTVVQKVRDSSQTIDQAASELTTGTMNLSQRTEAQAATIEETTATTQQVAAAVEGNSKEMRKAKAMAQAASDSALEGGRVVNEVVATMQIIEASSKKIAEIVGVIDGIAFQTNILALNAAVEAARAGDQGRGFAVVAAEVRNLAQRSATAAKEIKSLISDSVDKVTKGTGLVGEAGTKMERIVESSREVADILVQVQHAWDEQNQGIAQVNHAIGELDVSTQQNASLGQETAAAAESLRIQARALVDVVSVFRLPGSKAAALPNAPAAIPLEPWRRAVAASNAEKSPAKAPAKSDREEAEWQEF